jgi:hypothetical protein
VGIHLEWVGALISYSIPSSLNDHAGIGDLPGDADLHFALDGLSGYFSTGYQRPLFYFAGLFSAPKLDPPFHTGALVPLGYPQLSQHGRQQPDMASTQPGLAAVVPLIRMVYKFIFS